MSAPPPSAPPTPPTPAPPAAADPAVAAAAATTARRLDPSFTVSQLAMMSLKDRIAREAPWKDNPLNSQQSYTYHFRFFMMQDEDYMTTVNVADGEIKPGDVFRAIDNLPVRVIAESGVTAAINIQDVKIESLVGPNMESTNTSPTSFTINLVEPLGTSLVETMRNAANDLDIRNMDKAPYFLELTFKGYDEKGDPVSNGDSNGMAGLLADEYDNGGRWLYQIKITDIETELTASGSSYTVKALPYNEFAFDPLCGTCPGGMTISGATVGEMLDSFTYELNRLWRIYYQLETYVFDFDVRLVEGDPQNDPRQYRLVPIIEEHEEVRNFAWKEGAGTPSMTIYLGCEVSTVVETIMAASQEARTKAAAIILAAESILADEEAEESRRNRTQAGTDLYKEARMFRLEPDIEITGYNYKDNLYRKKITFLVWPFYTQTPVLSRQSAAHARDPEVQSGLIHQLIDRGFMRKKYDYLFTGKNTEITRLDIRYNLAWVAVLPVLNPVLRGTEETAVQALVDEEEVASAERAAEARARGETSDDTPVPLPPPSEEQGTAAGREVLIVQDEITRKEEEIARATAASEDADVSALQAELVVLQNRLGAVAREIDRNKAAVAVAVADSYTMERRVTAGRQRGADKQYLEDLDGPKEEKYSTNLYDSLPNTISFGHAFNQGNNAIGSGYASTRGVGRGVYGAILEQMYGPLTTGLISIDMEIRGDPYWLSHSNVERRLHFRHGAPPLTPSSQMANYSQGDNVFMLEFSYPFNVNDDGSPNIREEGGERIDKFTGLYRAIRVTNTFNGGEFSQSIKAQRLPLHDLARALGFDGVHAAGNVSYNEAAADEAAGRARPSAANPAGDRSSPSPGGSTREGRYGIAPPRAADGGTGGANSAERLTRIDPNLRRVVEEAQRIDRANGYGFKVFSGRRTLAEQAREVRIGNSRTMNSNHLDSNAVDLVPFGSDGRTFDPQGYRRMAAAMDQASRNLGIPIEWGGRWRDPDIAHFQLRGGR